MSVAAINEEALSAWMPREERRRSGAFFTPAPLVEHVLDCIAPFISTARPLAFIDPACGAGAFLGAAGHRYPNASLFGLELSGGHAELCRARIPNARVQQGNALLGDLEALLTSMPGAAFEVWIGNPPYNGTSPILGNATAYSGLRALLPPSVELLPGTSLRDDFIFFLLLAAHRLTRRDGMLAFVTSSSLLDAFLYSPIRKLLLDWLNLAEVIELGRGVFAGTRVRTCVTVWRSSGAGRLSPVYRTRSPDAREFVRTQLGEPVPLAPSAPDWLLKPISKGARAFDDQWRSTGEPLSTLVPISFPGLKTRFDELLVDDQPKRLAERIRDFLSDPNPGRIAHRHAIPERCLPKLEVLCGAVKLHGVRFDAQNLRPFFRYAGAKHRGTIPLDARAWCYLDRRLIPRGDHRFQGLYDPHACPKKLVFNIRELPLAAAVAEEPGCIHDYRHSRFAPLFVPAVAPKLSSPPRNPAGEVLNLSTQGRRWAQDKDLAPIAVFRAIADFINSREVQEVWAPAFGSSRELWVPLSQM